MSYNFPFSFSEVLTINGVGSIGLNETKDIKCPFCEDKHKHLNIVNKPPIKVVFRCNRCNTSGGVLEFHKRLNGLTSNKEALADIYKNLNMSDADKKAKTIEFKKAKATIRREPKTLPLSERNRRYNEMLNELHLEGEHFKALRNRGLSENFIKQRRYKSIAVSAEDRKKVADALGPDAKELPGFCLTNEGYIQRWLGQGTLLPVRSLNGQIQGFQVRLDNPDKAGRKYIAFSSRNQREGGRMESYTHIACDFMFNDQRKVVPKINPKATSIKLTEGCLKADVYYCLTGEPMLAVLGVNALGHLKQTLLELRRIYPQITTVEDCFDMDFETNEEVQKACERLQEMLEEIGFFYERKRWDKRFKGIDDFAYDYILSKKSRNA